MNDPLRIGIIGLGKMGQIRACEIGKRSDSVVVCGADPNESTFEHFAGIDLSCNLDDIINADIDAVCVCTPNYLTADCIIRSLESGKHVFSEKPPGRTVEEIERIIAAEKAHPQFKLKFGFNHRYHAGIQEAYRIVNSGRLGKLLWVRGVYGKAGGPGFEKGWRSNKEMAGGGILLDQGIHMLDLFRFFCGDFVEVKSMVDTCYWDIPIEDNAFALLRDANGHIAMIHSSSTQWKHKFSLELYLSEGYLSVNGILSSSRSYGEESITVARKKFDDGFAQGKPREETIYFDTDPSWELEMEEFVEAVLHGRPIRYGTSEDALNVMKLVYRIYENDRKHLDNLGRSGKD